MAARGIAAQTARRIFSKITVKTQVAQRERSRWARSSRHRRELSATASACPAAAPGPAAGVGRCRPSLLGHLDLVRAMRARIADALARPPSAGVRIPPARLPLEA